MIKGSEAIKIIDDTFRYGHTDDEGYEVPPYKMCHVCDEEFEIAEKELKAFDIIKKYAVNDGWSNGWVIKFWDMNEEELEVVNEVLKNE